MGASLECGVMEYEVQNPVIGRGVCEDGGGVDQGSNVTKVPNMGDAVLPVQAASVM